MRQMIGRALLDLALGIKPQIFANLGAALVLIEHDDAVRAYIGIDQIEMQIGELLQGRAPVSPNLVFAAQRAGGRSRTPGSCPMSFRCPPNRAKERVPDRVNSRLRSIPGREWPNPLPRDAGFPWFPPFLSLEQIRSIILTYFGFVHARRRMWVTCLCGCEGGPRRVIPTHDSSTARPRVDAINGLGA
jgi:hypothetical protein